MAYSFEDNLPDIVVATRGGVVISIHARDKHTKAVVVDWDEITDEQNAVMALSDEHFVKVTNEMHSLSMQSSI